jgi:P27 family predicted phage terminase small subunit
VKSAAVRRREGAEVRARHEQKGSAGTLARSVEPPSSMMDEERDFWGYYAPLQAARGLLTHESRDVLANYCTALATVARLKRQQAMPEYRDVMLSVTVDGAGNEHVKAVANPLLLRVEKWIAICHTLENDLGMNPATAMRMPRAEEDTPADAPEDFFGEPLRAVK